MFKSVPKTVPLVLLVGVLTGCVSIPKPLSGEYPATQPRDSAASGRIGERVRWGGIIIAVEPMADRTCIQILSRELGKDARPRQRDPSEGRFLACRNGFYDPEVFADGRDVTITGTVAAMTTRVVGEYSYTMPEVAADVIYLWPPRREPGYYHAYPTWSFWYGGPAWVWPHYHHPRPILRPPPPPRERAR